MLIQQDPWLRSQWRTGWFSKKKKNFSQRISCQRKNAILCYCLTFGNFTAWWHHQMETFSALVALYVGNSPVTSEFPSQRPVTQSFDVFFDLRLIKGLSKQSGGWWFETPSCSLWHHCHGYPLAQLAVILALDCHDSRNGICWAQVALWKKDCWIHVFRLKSVAWASYQIRKIACCACAGNAGNVFPTGDFKGNR